MLAADYSMTDLSPRANAAAMQCKAYLDRLEEGYQHRRLELERAGADAPRGQPYALCGHGRAGKDTAAEYICSRLGIDYPSSNSWQMRPIIARMVGISEDQAWQERHQHREFWIAACHAFRGADLARIARMSLGAGDIIVGTRGRLELEAIMRTGVAKTSIWIDNPRVPIDPTVEYEAGDCDLIIPNHGSRLALYSKLDRFLTTFCL